MIKELNYACALALTLTAVACGGSTPTTPTQAVTQTAPPAPAPISKADIELASSTAVFSCITGLCTSLTYPVRNLGPGCATNAQIVTRAYGSDGNGIQLGVDIPMGLPGGSLSTFFFRPGTSVTLQSIGPFNDVRSAHTAFKSFISWTDVACQ
jgi:hypothetical protein